MRIAVWYNLHSGGSKRALYDHLGGLRRRGHEIEIWHPPLTDTTYLDLSEFGPDHEVPLANPERSSWFKPWTSASSITQSDRLSRNAAEHAQKCVAEMSAKRFDVLFANTDLNFHAPHIGRYYPGPKLLYLNEPNRPLYEANPRMLWALPPLPSPGVPRPSIRETFRAYVMRRNVQRLAAEEIENAQSFDMILVNSLYSRESIIRTYARDGVVCYLGIDTDRFRDLGLEREAFVVSVGALLPQKNPELVIKAIGAVPNEWRPPLVWIYNVGAPAYVQGLEELARSLGVDFRPRHLLSDSELLNVLNRACAFVYAPHLEPFGLSPLEANACGLPVVAVAEGGVRETIQNGQNGLLAHANPESLAEQLMRVLRDKELNRTLGRRGKELVQENWTTEAATLRLEGHLMRIIGGDRHR